MLSTGVHCNDGFILKGMISKNLIAPFLPTDDRGISIIYQ